MCGMPFAVRRILAWYAASAPAGSRASTSSAPRAIGNLLTRGKLKSVARRRAGSAIVLAAQLEMLAPVDARDLEHLHHAAARRFLVEVVEGERHVAGRLGLRAHAELGLEPREQAARLDPGVLDSEDHHRRHASNILTPRAFPPSLSCRRQQASARR